MSDDEKRPEGLVGVADAIELLRAELEAAREAGVGEAVAFGVDKVELTLTTVLSAEGTVGGKVRWWLIEAGAEGKRTAESTQTIQLTLTPVERDGSGGSSSLVVADDEQAQPGR